MRRLFFLIVLTSLLSASLSACSAQSQSSEKLLAMAPMSGMPNEVRAAASTVQEAYQFAYANPDVMKQIPCYCGCGLVGHTSNYACYVSSLGADGKITFDSHALGCGICVDITRDVIRQLKEGKTIPDIRASIDQTYSKYGPSNMP